MLFIWSNHKCIISSMLLEKGLFYYFSFMLHKLWIELSLKCHAYVPLQTLPVHSMYFLLIGSSSWTLCTDKSWDTFDNLHSSCQHLTKQKKFSDNILQYPALPNKYIKGQFIKNSIYNFHKAISWKFWIHKAYLANQHLMSTQIWVSSKAKSFGSQPVRFESFLLN